MAKYRKGYKMNIHEDRETYIAAALVARKLARVAPLKVTFRATQETNERIMRQIAQTFKVYQYVHEEDGGIKYTEPWELFFWCYSDRDGRDMEYFTLFTNDTTTIAAREVVYSRLRALLETLAEDCEVCFEYHDEKDEAAIEAEALRAFRRCSGRAVEYGGRRGKLKWSERIGYYFMKDRARKNGWKLSPLSVCCEIREIA
jgi:hypothetical protein